MSEIKKRLKELKGKEILDLIETSIDEDVYNMVQTWPIDFDTSRALDLGFVKDNSISDVIKLFMKEEFDS